MCITSQVDCLSLGLLSWGTPPELPIVRSGTLRSQTPDIQYNFIDTLMDCTMKLETHLHSAAVALGPGSETSAILAQIN